MNHIKIYFAIMIVVITAFSSLCLAKSNYTDIEDTKYEEAVDRVTEEGIIDASDEDTFGVSETISRADMAKILVTMAGIENETPEKEIGFSDLNKNHWAYNFIMLAVERKMINGMPDGTFMPDETVSYAEIITMCLRYLGYQQEIEANGTWPTNYIAKAYELKLLENVEMNSVGGVALKGESAIIIYNIIEKYDSNGKIKVTIPKMKKDSYEYSNSNIQLILNYFDSEAMKIEENIKKFPGEYTAVVSLSDETRYIWEDGSSEPIEFEWEIYSDEVIEVPVPRLSESDYPFNGEEQQISLRFFQEEIMDISGDKQKDCGEHKAIIKLKDKENYIWSNGSTDDIELNWEIYVTIIRWDDYYLLEYNGKEQTIDIEDVIGHIGGNVNLENLISFTGNSATDVGVYKATLSLKDKVNSKWDDDTTEDKIVTWEMKKGSLRFEPYSPLFTYNGKEKEVSFKQLNSYYFSNEDAVNITGNVATNAGIYQAIISLKNKDNYDWYIYDEDLKEFIYTTEDQVVEWKIEKRPLNVPSSRSNVMFFNGKEQSISLWSFDETTMNLEGNVATNAGKYKAVVSLKDKNNFEWKVYNSDWETNGLGKYIGSTDDQIIEWEIKAKSVYVPHQLEIQEYKGGKQTADLYRLDLAIMDVEGNEASEVGKYTAKVSLKDKDNYAWEVWNEESKKYEYTSEDQYIDWEIGKATLEIYKKIQRRLEYTGEEQEVDYLFEIVYKNKITNENRIEEISISGDKGINAGTYEKVISLDDKENYTWKVYDEKKIKYEFTAEDQSAFWKIGKAPLEIPKQKNNLKYDGGEHTVNLRYFDEELMNISGDKATEIGEYKAEVSLKYPENYEWEDGTIENKFVKWRINKGELEWWDDRDTIVKYNGEEQTFYPEFFDEETMNITGNKATTVGTYQYTVSIKDKDKYEWDDGETYDVVLRWKLKKGDADIDVVNRNLVAGEDTELRYIVTPELTDGTVKILYEERNNGGVYTNVMPTEEGLYKVKLKLTGDSNLLNSEHEEYIFVKENNNTSGDSSQNDSTPNTTPNTTPSTTPNTQPSTTPSTTPNTQPSTTPNTTIPTTKPSTSNKGSSGGGGGGGAASTSYKITVTAGKNGEISPKDSVKVGKNSDKVFRITPNEGYQIKDVLVDGKSVGKISMYVFENVTEKHTIEASFEKVDENTLKEENIVDTNSSGDMSKTENVDTSSTTINSFKDINTDDWYYNAVKYVTENGLFKGVSENEFAAKTTMNRAMIVTVLHRLAGKTNTSENNTNFNDVEKGLYYFNAVSWAVENNIVNGTSDNEFSPLNNVTREQLVVMLYRYAKLIGKDVTLEKDLSSYEDFNDINSYAVEAFVWAVQEGIITGRTASTLAPKGTATRAEVATMLMRFEK